MIRRRARSIGGTGTNVLVAVCVLLALAGAASVLLLPRSAGPDSGQTVPAQTVTEAAAPQGRDVARIVARLEAAHQPFRARDLETVLAELAALDPSAVTRARAAHDPLPDDLADITALGEVFVARTSAMLSSLTLAGDGHHHDTSMKAGTPDVAARYALLIGDVRARLAAGNPSPTNAMERTDAAALRLAFDLASAPYRIDETFGSLVAGPSLIVEFAYVECCPPDQRASYAADYLEELSRELEATEWPRVGARRPVVELAIERCAQHATDLEELLARFEFAPPVVRKRLGAATNACAATYRKIGDHLRLVVLPESVDRHGIGPVSFAALLHANGLRETPAELFASAAAALETAAWERAAIEDAAAYDLDLPQSLLTNDGHVHVRALRTAAQKAISDWPEDPGVQFAPVPSAWSIGFAFMMAPPRGAVVRSVVLANGLDAPQDVDAFSRAFDGRLWRHVLAHEAYPGHHVHDVFARDASPLRHMLSSTVCVEGWAVHAVNVARDAGGIPDDMIDRWVRAADRADRAWSAMIEIAVHCLHATPDEIEDWDVPSEGLSAPFDVVRAAEEWPGLLIAYFAGPLEVARLEARAIANGEDVRDFRARFLRAGPLAPALLEDELFE